VKISMDGRGRALGNVFVERLWRTVKYEDVYLKDYETVPECRAGLAAFFERYNGRRRAPVLGVQVPAGSLSRRHRASGGGLTNSEQKCIAPHGGLWGNKNNEKRC
jgi:transposase InsO family protein